MARDAAAQREIERLTAEVERLRALELGLRAERERVRAETALELQGLQGALREAASRAGERGEDLERRLAAASAAERQLAQREARLRAADQALRSREAELEAERQRLAVERERLARESERLAEWEREARLGAPAMPVPATFGEGLGRLARNAARRSSAR